MIWFLYFHLKFKKRIRYYIQFLYFNVMQYSFFPPKFVVQLPLFSPVPFVNWRDPCKDVGRGDIPDCTGCGECALWILRSTLVCFDYSTESGWWTQQMTRRRRIAVVRVSQPTHQAIKWKLNDLSNKKTFTRFSVSILCCCRHSTPLNTQPISC